MPVYPPWRNCGGWSGCHRDPAPHLRICKQYGRETQRAIGNGGDGRIIRVAVVDEHRRSLRNPVESKERRVARNLGVAGVSAVLLHFAERPVSVPLAKLVERRRLGLLQRLSLPAWLETLWATLMLDYTMYLWHVLEYRVPVRWRFHAVHHADLDLDASTALRFHFGELAASIPWRAAQIVVIGVTPRTLAIYQRLLMLSVLFHHSNVRISTRTDRWLSRNIMTPRLHGIHHSVEHNEVNSN